MAFKDDAAIKSAYRRTEAFFKKHADVKDDLVKLIAENKADVGLKGAAQAIIGQTIKPLVQE